MPVLAVATFQPWLSNFDFIQRVVALLKYQEQVTMPQFLFTQGSATTGKRGATVAPEVSVTGGGRR